MLDNGIEDCVFHWDDAGTWLYVMSFHDPFVIAFMEYLALARTNWKGAVILSTPFLKWILKKLYASEGILHLRIRKVSGEGYRQYRWKPRIAKCYKKVKLYPGAQRICWPTQSEDCFSALMPDPFCAWYRLRRDRYALIAATKMHEEIKKRKKKGFGTELAEKRLEELKKELWEANRSARELEEVAVFYEKPH